MTSETPAILVTAVLAVVLIAVSAPFTYMWWGEGTTTYEIAWEEAETGSADAQLNGAPQDDAGEVAVDNKLVSNVTLEVTTCNDGTGTPPLHPAAQMSYRLFFRAADGTQVEVPGVSGAFTCASADSAGGRFAVSQKPNLGAREVEEDNEDESNERAAARAGVWDADLVGGLNRTGTYVLELSSTRGPSTLPLGAPPATLSVTMNLKVEHWEALLHETGSDEVVR